MRFAPLPKIGGVLFLSLIIADAAQAQPADPIDALLRQSQAQAQGKAIIPAPEDEEAAEAAGRPLVPEADPTPGLPRGPIPYALELVDRARGELEGAWRDLRKPGASGFVDEISRNAGGDLTLRFADASATLRGGGAQWSGQIQDGGRSQAAVLRRVNK
jgi:hypothetical protein